MAQFKSFVPETDFSYLRIFAPMTATQKKVWRVACGLISGYTDVAHTSHKFFYEPRYIVFDKG